MESATTTLLLQGVRFHFVSFSSAFSMGDVTTFIPPFQGGVGVTGAKSSDSMGVGQGTPWTSRQLITLTDGSGCH